MGSEVLSRNGSGTMFFMYLVTSMITVIFAISSSALNSTAYNQYCSSTNICSSFLYVLPAIAATFSIITLILAILQLRLYHTRAITGITVFAINTFSSTLWLIVLVIGWSPTNVDTNSGIIVNSNSVTGWFLFIRDAYNAHLKGSPYGQDTATMNFSFGLLIMTCIIFTISILLALFGLTIHLQDNTISSSSSSSDSRRTTRLPPGHHTTVAAAGQEEAGKESLESV